MKGVRAEDRGVDEDRSFVADAWTAVKPYSVIGFEEDMVLNMGWWGLAGLLFSRRLRY